MVSPEPPLLAYTKFRRIYFEDVYDDLDSNLDLYTTLTNFSTKYLVMCNVYTGVGGIK